MLELDGKLILNEKTIRSPNLCHKFSDEDLKRIGTWCSEGYEKDKISRAKWERRNEAGMDLAMQVQKTKTFPWQNCSNIAFPLVTIAAMQFHARAYSAIISGPSIVRYRAAGEDSSGELFARALRIGDHMSWQVLEEDDAWEDQHDRLLLNLSIVGCAFVKTYYSATLGHNVSELIPAKDLVLSYYSKSIEVCPRKTQIIPIFRNDIYERVMRSQFRDILEEAWFRGTPPDVTASGPQQVSADNRTGTSAPSPADELTPFICLEQHCLLDLDKDGYAEPYIITFEQSSKEVLRIVTGFDREEDVTRSPSGRVISIQPMQYFTKYSFIPSPDGGIYDVGFGVLLGPLNEAANSIMNQMVDAGTLANTAGGFLSRGARIRSGPQTFSPFQWNRVDVSGEDLQKSMLPIPVREPSSVLFQLLVLLINYTGRISGSTDTVTGENPGQNTPASTNETMLQQGLSVYNSIFKRVWRSMKHEFQRLYVLNAINLPTSYTFGNSKQVMREDYKGRVDWVAPVADPTISSDRERIAKAQFVADRAHMVPGYNIDETELDLLRAVRADGIERLYLGMKKTGPLPNPRVQVEQMKLQGIQLKVKADQQKFLQELQEEHRMNSAKILEIEAKAALEMEEAGGVKTGHELQMFQLALSAIKEHNGKVQNQIQNIIKGFEVANDYRDTSARVRSLEAGPSDSGGSSGSGASS